MAFGIKKLHLVDKTPVERLDNISRDLGVEFYIKRDDLTSFGSGGNKLRKLEYLMQEALDKGSTLVLTVGGSQTNHGSPCYTGKGFAGILQMISEGKIKKGEKIIFIHTGGFPGIYTPHHRKAFEEELKDGVRLI